MVKTVWILGAGFSRSLGGPLLPDLLSSESQRKIALAYPRENFPLVQSDAAEDVLALYQRFGPEGERVRRRWVDAEGFLDALDTAALTERGSMERRYLSQGSVGIPLKSSIESAADAARRLIAAECCLFLGNAVLRTEVWGPYRRWARQLNVDDAIITFNYDTVVEKAMELQNRGNDLHVLFPGAGPDGKRVPLLKLHGSVDWRCTNGTYSRGTPTLALTCPNDDDLVIASPGPTKRKVTENLIALWDKAKDLLRAAEVIVFVGYRFPPSDSFARQSLLSAIAENRAETLSVHLVLGQNTQEPATQRLGGLLYYTGAARERAIPKRRSPKPDASRSSLSVHPLFAEDFLDLYAPDQLAAIRGEPL